MSLNHNLSDHLGLYCNIVKILLTNLVVLRLNSHTGLPFGIYNSYSPTREEHDFAVISLAPDAKQMNASIIS
jgi:hypothetical protein